jgi:hypothetical protein
MPLAMFKLAEQQTHRVDNYFFFAAQADAAGRRVLSKRRLKPDSRHDAPWLLR